MREEPATAKVGATEYSNAAAGLVPNDPGLTACRRKTLNLKEARS